jgi:cytochrome c-type biogenesis protein CcmH/NrfG
MTEAGMPAADLQEAMERHRHGDLAAARRLYLQHLQQRPGDVEGLCLLAALEGQGGNHSGAEAAYRRAVAEDADHGPAYAGLGASLLLQDRPGDAAEALAQAVRLMPEQPEIRLQLALALQRSGRLPQARQVLTDVVERWPDHLPGRHNLGLVLGQTGDPDGSAEQFRFVVRKDPTRYAAWLGLARALMGANDPDGAEKALIRAGELCPDDPDAKRLLGNLLRGRGRYPEAEAVFEAVLADRPGDTAAMLGLAELDLALGRPSRGLERLAPLLDKPGAGPGVVKIAARLMIADERYAEVVSRIDRWLESPVLRPLDRAALLSIKGRALDELGETDEAWRTWTGSHAQIPSRFDGAHFTYAVDHLIGAYDEEVFAAHRDVGPHSRSMPLLVVGTPRSGKSILEHLLACHPRIRGAGELRHLGAMTHEVARRVGSPQRPYPACIRALRGSDLEDLAREYRRAIDELAGDATWVVDTQPTNFLHIGLAALLNPDVKVIFCRRDPIDTAWACFRTHFADPGLDFVASPEGIARYLTGMYRLMRHWQSTGPVGILEVSYEDLVRSPRDTLGTVIEYLGLEWADELMDYTDAGRPKLAGPPALMRPLDDGEIGRGAAYRDRFDEVIRLMTEGDHVR